MHAPRPLDIRNLGRMRYAEALAIQEELVTERLAERVPDTLLLVEHPPVITLGRSAEDTDILLDESERSRVGVDIHRVTRGGLATYHGPGQIVGYPIVHLYERARHLKRFIADIEQMFVLLLDEVYGISAHTDPENRGVWVGDEKITAVGIAVRNRVTMHGFAFNVSTDLSHFGWIVPCGIRDRGVTSLSRLLGAPVAQDEALRNVTRYFCSVFEYSC